MAITGASPLPEICFACARKFRPALKGRVGVFVGSPDHGRFAQAGEVVGCERQFFPQHGIGVFTQ